MRLFANINIDFMGKRSIFFLISGIIILLGVINIAVRGLAFGIDFKGGTEIALQFEKPIDISFVRNQVDKIGLGDVEVKTFGGSTGILLRSELQEIPATVLPKVKSRIETLINQSNPGIEKQVVTSSSSSITYSFADSLTAEKVSNQLFSAGFQTTVAADDATGKSVVVRLGIADWLKDNLTEKFKDNPFVVQKEDKVGPKVGQELKTDAVIAVALALIVILLYIGFRFKFSFAIGAVIALFHDVLITLSLFSILYGVIPGLNLEVTLTVVAAFLTLIGYSMNDTVVVFDRVREHLKIHKTIPLEENMNRAINNTFSRTIITGLSTMFMIIILIIMGGEVLRGFAFALFVGMITGTYSSIFVASAFVLEYANRTKSKVTF
ncbi:MAG: protein-export membrane protein SecF [Stygiobacter sp. RIFOXYC12_FULL_38_8]|nr:MAG: protein-export membrane protein SecF [Stygiobacter sp. RIFOXYA12_FULL_38_9]OGV08118.1 MAG: protein-export membrane protein SecF [Stygiobacter sp. RIFOXYB2_FULL_37_11]OGV11882.1 MAG: protein-export membrane protein SecF [Stygiobacter sp. RIFOXYA2_FULL_38_8]OGV15634.1 MAG: protein-export membrane protein SecF [Stygiobacter sp. RIFOXYC2_FULL_38_25]OGV23968.1 MAG: protein-export membrane protein SecF [Stygiobacter sp. RIFOXYC12_FULL_38_8]OGV80748.1 MAG: protein-export membrane protein SecF